MLTFKINRLLALGTVATLMSCGGPSHIEEQSSKEQHKPEGTHHTHAANTPHTSETVPAASNSNSSDIHAVSESFGNFIGRNLHSPGIDFDIESIIKGIREGAAGKPAPLSDEEYEKAMLALQEKAFSATSQANLSAADEFMKKNASAQGVVQIVPEKLQYLILEEGHGPIVNANNTPKINYTGKYIDGKEFGTSGNNGPISVPLEQTIPGFSKGILGMKEGEKRRLFVHPSMGYGTAGMLQPNALLIFDVEVVKADDPEFKASLKDLESDLDEESGSDEEEDDKKDHEHPHETKV